MDRMPLITFVLSQMVAQT